MVVDTHAEVIRMQNAAANDAIMHQKASDNREVQLEAARQIMIGHGVGGRIADDKLFAEYKSHLDAAAYWDRQADFLAKSVREHDEFAHHIRVSEPRTYSPDSPNSYFLDLATVAAGPSSGVSQVRYVDAKNRMQRYSQELAAEVRTRTDEGRHVLSCIREQYRTSDELAGRSAREVTQEAEQRAASTAASSLGTFVTPVYLVQETAKYRAPVAAFVDESNQLPLPEYGLDLHIPEWSSPPVVAQQLAENQGIPSAVPTANYLSDPIPVVTLAGSVPVSQQLFDRADPAEGPTFDALCMAQMTEQLDAAVDAYVLGVVIATGETVTEGTTLTIPLLYSNLSTAREQMSNALGVRLKASHVFATSDVLEWLFAQVDSEQRPIITPDPASLIATTPAGQMQVDGTFTGVWLNRQGLWEDDNIPAYTGQPTWAQVIVADMRHVLSWRSAVLSTAYCETSATTLSVNINLRQYVAAVARYGDAVQVISGAGYAGLS